MKTLMSIFGVLLLFPTLVMAGEKEDTYLKETMIPLAQQFLQRIGQTNNLPLGTNQIKHYRLNYFNDRTGCTANLRLTNDCYFFYHTETNSSEVCIYRRPIKTYYSLAVAPSAKVDAVKALNLQNKLSKDAAMSLAKKYFQSIGHKEDNFRPPEIIQSYWSGGEDILGGRLPYYEITWYRKDVTEKELEDNDSNAKLKTVIIEVSGIDSSLISYSKGLLPVGSDF